MNRLTGIIPAYAGSTAYVRETYTLKEDHPRIRGEHELDFACDAELLGSSPHTRGAHVDVAVAGVAVWIIPAYAGSTST